MITVDDLKTTIDYLYNNKEDKYAVQTKITNDKLTLYLWADEFGNYIRFMDVSIRKKEIYCEQTDNALVRTKPIGIFNSLPYHYLYRGDKFAKDLPVLYNYIDKKYKEDGRIPDLETFIEDKLWNKDSGEFMELCQYIVIVSFKDFYDDICLITYRCKKFYDTFVSNEKDK